MKKRIYENYIFKMRNGNKVVLGACKYAGRINNLTNLIESHGWKVLGYKNRKSMSVPQLEKVLNQITQKK